MSEYVNGSLDLENAFKIPQVLDKVLLDMVHFDHVYPKLVLTGKAMNEFKL